jgi:hypothetical protein
MSDPVTGAALACPICNDLNTYATASFKWPRGPGGHGRTPMLIAFDCPNGCELDDQPKQRRHLG